MTVDLECQARPLLLCGDENRGAGASSSGSDLGENSLYDVHSQHCGCGPATQLNSPRSILVAFICILKRKIPASFASLYNCVPPPPSKRP